MAYNEHLFGNPVSRFFHLSRFKWLRENVQKHAPGCEEMLELGCFDGRSYDFLKEKPKRYRGLDADWDGGLSVAEKRFSGEEGVTFRHSASLEDFRDEEPFDAFVSMETMEHIRPRDLPDYLRLISRKLNGVAFITVPNETAAVFLAKNLAKMALGSSRPYTAREFRDHVAGRTWKVRNLKGGHRGFNYKSFLDLVSAHLDIVSVEGLPFRKLPLGANTTIAVVAKSR